MKGTHISDKPQIVPGPIPAISSSTDPSPTPSSVPVCMQEPSAGGHNIFLEQGLNRLYCYRGTPSSRSGMWSQLSPWRLREVMIAEEVTGMEYHDPREGQPGMQDT